MNITSDTIKFYQYDAKQTIHLRQNWKQSKTDEQHAILMKEIDEDYVDIKEEKCPSKNVCIGKNYQVSIIPSYNNKIDIK